MGERETLCQKRCYMATAIIVFPFSHTYTAAVFTTSFKGV
jgi:hypothetical protein